MKKLDIFLKSAICVLLTVLIVLTASGCLHFSPEPEKEDAPYLDKVNEIVELIDTYYVDDYSTDTLDDYLADAVINSVGDRWSYYISAEDYDAYMEQSNNAYVGIGVTIRQTDENDPGFTIVSVAPNSPAEAAGLQTGDMILAVGGVNAVESGMTQTQQMVRGEEGTDVVLTILRGDGQFDVTITRATVETEIVSCELLSSGDGYIKINNFDANAARDTIAAIEEMTAQGAKALIFDLRFNPGGYKHELVEVLDYLLPEGPLFRSVDYLGQEDVDYSDENCLEIPMAVIVNRDSYSAAEFFAAALQEYGAATVVGEQTCGKANYQQTFRLSDGSAVAISTGHYQTPNGVTLAGVGITPDVPVAVDDETYNNLYYGEVEKQDDEQLQAAIDALSAPN